MALSDPLGILASPLTIINRGDEKADIEAIIDIVNEYQVEQIIVGLPRSMDGGISKQEEKVKDFTQDIGDVLIDALYPITGLRFLKWKYGLETPPPEVQPVPPPMAK